ncbi:MAG: pilus assembly protein PilM [Pseudomonadota bacterium]
MLAVRVDSPFGPRPRIEACAYHSPASEASFPQAFADFARDLSADGLPVVVSVNSQLASLLQLSLPEVPEAELASALKFRAREISPVPVDDMVLDYVEVPGMRARGGEKTGYCAVARLSQMRALRDALKSSGMTLAAIDIEDMVLRHLLARFQPGEENGALLFVGAQGSRVIVARGDRLYLFRSSNIGAHHLEGRTPQGLRPGMAEGTERRDQLQQDRLDQGEGLSLGRVEGLVLEIQRTLDFYDSHFTDPPPRQIWLAPGWPFIPHLARQLGDQLRLPLREIALADVFDGTQRIAGQPADLACLALGAALRPREGGSRGPHPRGASDMDVGRDREEGATSR